MLYKLKSIVYFLVIILMTSLSNGVTKVKELEEAAFNYMYFSEFNSAKDMINKAIELEPNNSSLKLTKGRVLIASKNFNDAVDTLQGLQLSGSESEDQILYLGIAYLGNGENDQAKNYLQKAQAISRISAEASKYLKQLDVNNKRYRVTADFGLNYDTRIIDEDLLSTTDGSGGRIFFSSDILYKAAKPGEATLNVGADITTMYSFDDDVSLGDAMVVTVHAPYSRKLNFFGGPKDFVFDSKFQQIWLDIDNDGTKESLMNSFVFQSHASGEISSDRSLDYKAELKYDNGLDDAVKEGANEVSGLGLTLGADWNHYGPSSEVKKWTASAYAKFNFAAGENMKYQRLGINYIYHYQKWGFNWAFLGALRYTIFPDYLVDRDDTYLSAGAVATKPLKEWVKADWAKVFVVEFKGSFTLNESSLDIRDYDRFILSSLLKGSWAF